MSDRELQIKISLARAGLAGDAASAARTIKSNLDGLKVDLNIDQKGINLAKRAIDELGNETLETARQAKFLKDAYNLNDSEVDKVIRKMQQLERSTESAKKEGGALGEVFTGFLRRVGESAFNGLINAVQRLGQAVAGLVADSVRGFVEFEGAIKQAGVISGSIGTEDFEALGDEVERLGIVTSKTPKQIADTSIALSRAGFSARETTGALEGIARASEATGDSLEIVGDIVAKTYRTFQGSFEAAGMEIGESSRFISNALVQTANSTNTSVNGLGESLSYIGPVAAAANQPLDDMLVLIGLLGDQGIQGSMAGTNLAAGLERLKIASAGGTTEFSNLVRGSARMTEAFNVIGAEVRNADGSMRSVLDILPILQANMADMGQADKDILMKALFGVEGGRAFQALLNTTPERLEQVKTLVKETAQEGEGAAVRGGEAMLTGLSGALDLIGGSIASLKNQFAESLSPALESVVRSAMDIINTLLEAEGLFDPITQGAERFAAALKDNPEILSNLTTQVMQFAEVLVGTIGSALDWLASRLEGLNGGSIAQLGEEFLRTAGNAASLAMDVGAVVVAIGDMVGNVGGAAVAAFNELYPVIKTTVEFLGLVVSVVRPLTDNTALLSIALQTLAIRMAAIQGIALAGAIQSATVAIGAQIAAAGGLSAALVALKGAALAAAAGLGVTAGAALAAAGPFIALAAAVAAVNFIKFVRELKVANDELAAYTTGLNVSTEQGFQFANKLNNLNDAITEAGGKATKEQQEQLANYVRLSKEQVTDLERQLSEVQAFEPKNDEQRNAQQGLISQLNSTITSLNNQITEAEGNLSTTAEGAGQGVAEGFNAGVENNPPAEIPEPESPAEFTALDDIAAKYQALTTTLETEQANQTRALVEGGKSREEIEAAERQFLDRRIKLNEQKLAELKAIDQSALSPEDAARVQQEILNLDNTLSRDRLKLAEDTRKAQEDGAKASTDAITDTTRQGAAAQSGAIQSVAQTAEEAHQDRLRQLEEEQRAQEALAQTELDLAETRLAAIDRVSEALDRQLSLLQAQGDLSQAVFDLETSLNDARKEQLNDVLGDEEASQSEKRKAARELIALTEEQFAREKEQLEAQQALELQQLELKQQQSALADQRAIKEQELALKKLDLQRLEIQNEIELARMRGDDAAVQIGEAQLGLLAEQTAAQQDYISSLREQAALNTELANGQRAALVANQAQQDIGLAQTQQNTAEGLQSQLGDANLGSGIDNRADRLGNRADRALAAELRQARNALPGLANAGVNPQVAAMATTPTVGTASQFNPGQIAQPIVAELQNLNGAINTLAASPRQLTVQTPDPVADTSAILGDITKMQTAGVNP